MNLLLILLILAIVAALLPVWPYSRTWGYIPTALGAIVLVIFLFLMITNTPPGSPVVGS